MAGQGVTFRLGTIWYVLGAIVSVQVGAAFAKDLFGVVPPVSMVWLRLLSSAVVLLLVTALRSRAKRTSTKPAPADRPRRDWFVLGGYAASLLLMNWAIYESFARIPLGIAVTIEFLGPLGVALWATRRLRDVLWVVLAAIGVVLLGFTPTKLTVTGVAFALLAAAGWAAYILIGGPVGRRWSGFSALTLSCCLGAIIFAVPAIVSGGSSLLNPKVLAIGFAVGVLSSVIPYSLELLAMRTVPPRVFGILMSIEPAVAALAAFIVLRETLSLIDLAAMCAVVAASVGVIRSS